MSPFDPESQPPVFDDSLSTGGTPSPVPPPPHTTTSGTEAAQAAGVNIGSEADAGFDGPDEMIGSEEAIDPDDRTDLEGPDQLEEEDGTITHPSFGAGVGLNLGMGTGAGSDEVEDQTTSDQNLI